MTREKLFIDTGGWIALIDSGDRFHRKASEFYLSLDPFVLRVTSSHVIAETYTWLRYKMGYQVAYKFLTIIRLAQQNDRIKLIQDHDELLDQAGQLLEDFQIRSFLMWMP